MKEMVVEGLETELIEKIEKVREKDDEVVKIIEQMKIVGVKALRENEWEIEEDLVLKEGKVYIPKNEKLRTEVMRNVRRYIEKCDLCQRMKNRTEVPVEKLMANEVLEKMWIHLTVDFSTKLLLVVEKDVILVVCDRLSKIAYFVATMEETLVEKLARLFRDNMQKLHRLLESVISDRKL